MIEITENAYRTLLNTLSDNLHHHSGYGTPPIFNWYQKMKLETQEIESCRYLRRGTYQYQLGRSLGIAHLRCEYVGRTRYLIITAYEINKHVLFSWTRSTQKGGIITNPKPQKPRKPFRRLTTKPLFGYTYVMNPNREYNLLDSNNRLVTQWFRAIRPFRQPYGKYRIIAYINIDGWFCGLGYDGSVYNLNRTWKETYTESRNYLYTDVYKQLVTETIDSIKQGTIRLTESQFKTFLTECIKKIITETDYR